MDPSFWAPITTGTGHPAGCGMCPRMEHGRDESFRTVRGFEIPQAEITFAYHYTCCVYPIGHRSDAWAEGMNEYQVAVAQTGVHAFQPIDASGAALEADDIPWIILERAASARQAIELVGETCSPIRLQYVLLGRG